MRRHRWVRLRAHTRMCRVCGMGKVDAQDTRGRWTSTYHLPDGRSITASLVPPCQPGPHTDAALRKYADAL